MTEDEMKQIAWEEWCEEAAQRHGNGRVGEDPNYPDD